MTSPKKTSNKKSKTKKKKETSKFVPKKNLPINHTGSTGDSSKDNAELEKSSFYKEFMAHLAYDSKKYLEERSTTQPIGISQIYEVFSRVLGFKSWAQAKTCDPYDVVQRMSVYHKNKLHSNVLKTICSLNKPPENPEEVASLLGRSTRDFRFYDYFSPRMSLKPSKELVEKLRSLMEITQIKVRSAGKGKDKINKLIGVPEGYLDKILQVYEFDTDHYVQFCILEKFFDHNKIMFNVVSDFRSDQILLVVHEKSPRSEFDLSFLNTESINFDFFPFLLFGRENISRGLGVCSYPESNDQYMNVLGNKSLIDDAELAGWDNLKICEFNFFRGEEDVDDDYVRSGAISRIIYEVLVESGDESVVLVEDDMDCSVFTETLFPTKYIQTELLYRYWPDFENLSRRGKYQDINIYEGSDSFWALIDEIDWKSHGEPNKLSDTLDIVFSENGKWEGMTRSDFIEEFRKVLSTVEAEDVRRRKKEISSWMDDHQIEGVELDDYDFQYDYSAEIIAYGKDITLEYLQYESIPNFHFWGGFRAAIMKKSEVTIVKVDGYPDTFSFETTEKFPKFTYGCQKRQKVLLDMLYKYHVKSQNHEYEDYVVEVVEKEDNIEYWQLGS